MEEDQARTDGGSDLGTWSFLKAGWWVLHVIAISCIFYLGYLFGGSLFR